MSKVEDRNTRSVQRFISLQKARPLIIAAAIVLGNWIGRSHIEAQLPCSTGNKLQDSGFETSTDNAGIIANPYWNSSSTAFTTSLCNGTECGNGGGTAGPRGGGYWVWFGGTPGPETGTVNQAVTIPSGANVTLNYYLRVGAVESPFTDVFRVKVDGATVQTIIEPSVAESVYTLRSVNLGAYADGNVHIVSFQYDSPSNGGVANFNLDDVTLDVSCPLTTLVVALPQAELANISTRVQVGTGNDALIAGFIVTGMQAKKVMVRGVGPSLTPLGVSAALVDPTLELHDSSGGLIASNDNWQTTQIGGAINASQVSQIQGSGLAPTNAAESAIIATLSPGAYTAVLRGKSNTTGVGVVEAYDLDQVSTSKLANISTRGFVQTGDKVLIGGLIVAGDIPRSVVIRAIGPSLGPLGITNPLADPILEVHDGNGTLIDSNDNWMDSAQSASIQAARLAPSGTLESAIMGNFSPGAYTAIVQGKNNTTGVALVEAYDLDSTGGATTLQPLSVISLPGSGFNATADVFVRFTGPKGFSIDAPAFDVTATSLRVVVPPYLDPVTQSFGSAPVSVQVIQTKGSVIQVSNMVSGIQIADLPPLQLPPGTITANWAALLESELSNIKADLAAAALFSGGQVDTTDLQKSLETCRTRFGELKSLVRTKLAGDPQTPVVAVINNVPVTLNASTLRQSDQLLMAALQQVLSAAGQRSSAFNEFSGNRQSQDGSTQATSACPLTTVQILDAVIHNPNSDAIVDANYGFYLQQCADDYRATATDFSHLALTLSVAELVAPYTFPASGGAALTLGTMSLVTQGMAARLESAANAVRANDPVAFARAEAAWSGTYKGAVCFAASAGIGKFATDIGVLFDIESELTGICETEMPQYESLGAKFLGVNPPGPTPTPTPSATPVPCSSVQVAGGDAPETRTIEMGRMSGTFNFSYDTYSIADRIVVLYEGKTLFDTGCVGASGSVNILYIGTSTTITVQVTPNCAGGSGTQWTFKVGCPM
jgi:hypothetical protein